jgi:hypothetical protein
MQKVVQPWPYRLPRLFEVIVITTVPLIQVPSTMVAQSVDVDCNSAILETFVCMGKI